MSLLRGEWHDIGAVVIYAAGVGLCSLVIPIAVQSLVNSVAFGTLIQPIIILSALVAGILLFSGILRLFQIYIIEILQRRLVVRFALFLSKRLPHVLTEEFNRKFGPEYVLRFMEVFNAQKIISLLLLDGTALVFQLVIGLILVSFYHPFFLVFSLLIITAVLIVTIIFGLGGVSTSIKESSAKYHVLAWLQDLVTVPTLFKSQQGEEYAIKKTDYLVDQYLDLRTKHFKIIFRQNIGALLLQTIGSALLLFLGGFLVLKQELSLGQLVSAELIFSMVLISFTKIGKHLEKFYDLAASLNKLESLALLPYETLLSRQKYKSNLPIMLTIKNVSAQSLTGEFIFRDLSLQVEASSKIAIWAGNGVGKTYLTNIIYRLASPFSGVIEINGYNIFEISPLELRTSVYLCRDIEMFHGSIIDNLTFNKEIDRVKCREVLKKLDLLDFIDSLPQGIDTVVRGSTDSFSRGQALTLMIARAILSEANLIIIDGTLDTMDEELQGNTCKALLNLEGLSTLIVFTHEKNIMRFFSNRYQMTKGGIVKYAI